MLAQGVQFQLLIGPTVAAPAPRALLEALESAEVTLADEGRSGFQLTFRTDRSGPQAASAEALFASPLVKIFNRVILGVVFAGTPRVLIDGFITDQQLQPGGMRGSSTLTLTGEDISLALDREEKDAEHPALPDNLVVMKILASYAQYGLVPMVIPPLVMLPPLPTERVPAQHCTDLQHIQNLAKRHGYTFYITAGPLPGANTAYWGPPIRVGVPQRALSLNMGAHSNVNSINFRHNALAATLYSGATQDEDSNKAASLSALASARPPLASQPSLSLYQSFLPARKYRKSGGKTAEALEETQGQLERSTDEVLTATGELDVLRYGDLLQPRGLVGLRGAGLLYDGLYYVKEVTHHIERGSYRQSFRIGREGLGSTVPVVKP